MSRPSLPSSNYVFLLLLFSKRQKTTREPPKARLMGEVPEARARWFMETQVRSIAVASTFQTAKMFVTGRSFLNPAEFSGGNPMRTAIRREFTAGAR